MRYKHTSVTCDSCRKIIHVNEFDSGMVDADVERRGWIVERMDLYGNNGDFCSIQCLHRFSKTVEVCCGANGGSPHCGNTPNDIGCEGPKIVHTDAEKKRREAVRELMDGPMKLNRDQAESMVD